MTNTGKNTVAAVLLLAVVWGAARLIHWIGVMDSGSLAEISLAEDRLRLDRRRAERASQMLELEAEIPRVRQRLERAERELANARASLASHDASSNPANGAWDLASRTEREALDHTLHEKEVARESIRFQLNDMEALLELLKGEAPR